MELSEVVAIEENELIIPIRGPDLYGPGVLGIIPVLRYRGRVFTSRMGKSISQDYFTTTAGIAKAVAVFSIFVGRKLMKTNKHLQGMLDQGPQ